MDVKDRLRTAIKQLQGDLHTIECWLDYGVPSDLPEEEIESYINKIGTRGKCISNHLVAMHEEIKKSYKIIK